MAEFQEIYIYCSLDAYSRIEGFLMNSHHELPHKSYCKDKYGYFHYYIDQWDVLLVDTYCELNEEIDRLKKLGVHVGMLIIDR